MPNNAKRKGPWSGYVCSGTVADDGGTTNRSVIITAAHCVYDDVNKAFARNVLFIPDQAHTTPGSKTDLNCSNDPMGCWIPSFGVVDEQWTTRTFPNNIRWDYAFYVVNNSGAHATTSDLSQLKNDALDSTAFAGSLVVRFEAPAGAFTYALGYSYSEDPKFMYCAEDRTTESKYGDWWLPNCGLSGGSSGGPWVQPMDTDTGSGPIISVNSWGYTNSPGMGGPNLVSPPNGASSASCVFSAAKSNPFPSTVPGDGNAGSPVSCP